MKNLTCFLIKPNRNSFAAFFLGAVISAMSLSSFVQAQPLRNDDFTEKTRVPVGANIQIDGPNCGKSKCADGHYYFMAGLVGLDSNNRQNVVEAGSSYGMSYTWNLRNAADFSPSIPKSVYDRFIAAGAVKFKLYVVLTDNGEYIEGYKAHVNIILDQNLQIVSADNQSSQNKDVKNVQENIDPYERDQKLDRVQAQITIKESTP